MEVITGNDGTVDVSTERTVLGYMLIDSVVCSEIVCKVTVDHFGLDIHRELFKAILALHADGVASIDSVTLIMYLSNNSNLLGKDVTSQEVTLILNSLFELSSELNTDNVSYFVSILDNVYSKRDLVKYLENSAETVKDDIRNNKCDFSDHVVKVESGLIDRISKKETDEPEDIFTTLKPFAEKLFEDKKEIVGLSTGFPTLDDNIDGMENGTLTVIAAHKKVGKSTCCMNIALNSAINENIPILYIDTEMSTDKNKTRILSHITGIPEKKLKRGDISDKERDMVNKVLDKFDGNIKYYHKYVPGFTIEGVTSLIRSYYIKHGIKLAIFDYIKAGSSADFKNLKEYQLLGNMTIALKDLAGMLDIPILTAVQRSREGDIADSDRIARYADTIIFLDVRSKDEIDELGFSYGLYKFVVKHARSGGTTNEKGIGLHFRRQILTLYEANKQLTSEELAPLGDSFYEEKFGIEIADKDNDESDGIDAAVEMWGG